MLGILHPRVVLFMVTIARWLLADDKLFVNGLFDGILRFGNLAKGSVKLYKSYRKILDKITKNGSLRGVMRNLE
jgi:hypothetical protein